MHSQVSPMNQTIRWWGKVDQKTWFSMIMHNWPPASLKFSNPRYTRSFALKSCSPNSRGKIKITGIWTQKHLTSQQNLLLPTLHLSTARQRAIPFICIVSVYDLYDIIHAWHMFVFMEVKFTLICLDSFELNLIIFRVKGIWDWSNLRNS